MKRIALFLLALLLAFSLISCTPENPDDDIDKGNQDFLNGENDRDTPVTDITPW